MKGFCDTGAAGARKQALILWWCQREVVVLGNYGGRLNEEPLKKDGMVNAVERSVFALMCTPQEFDDRVSVGNLSGT